MFGIAAVVLLPVLAVTSGPLMGSTSGLIVVAYLAFVPMSLAYLLFGAGLQHVRASSATTLSPIEPVVATAIGVLVVGERFTVASWAGMGLIAMGLLILITRRARH